MKIVFFGTPDFAVPVLDGINKSEHEVMAVVTAPDKARGRGKKITFTPVKDYAVQNELPVLQPEKLKSEIFVEDLKKYNADLFVVVAFRILPIPVFTLPKLGSINLHGSMLPAYRGAAPIQWALINGDKKTGLTTFFLKEKVDTGNIILQKEIEILEEDNFETLHDKMRDEGVNVVLATLYQIENNKVMLTEQDDSLVSPAPKITKETCKIDWNNNSIDIRNLIRGLSPFPGAFFELNGKKYKVYKSIATDNTTLDVGEIKQTKEEIFIGCEKGEIEILEIQPEGRKRMTTADFLRGYSLKD